MRPTRTCWPRSSGWTGPITVRLAGDSEEAEAIKLVARTHQSMIWDRSRQVLRLRSALRDFFPAALTAFPDLDAPDALELLAKAPDPDRAAPADQGPDHRRVATGEPARCRGQGRADPGQVLRAEQLRQSTAVQAAYAAIVSGQVALVRPEHPDRGDGRGGGRPFWPAPGR